MSEVDRRDSLQQVLDAIAASRLSDFNSPNGEELLRNLILLESADDEPPPFHTALANLHSGGVDSSLARAASVLEPVLGRMVDESPIAKNTVLMLILLRAHLVEPSPDDISALHLKALDQFTVADLSLPYSDAFTSAFDDNRDDIRRAFAGAAARSMARLPLPHLLVFEWLIGTPTISPSDLERKVAELDPADRTGIEAARSLTVRHRGSAHAPQPVGPPVEPAIEALRVAVRASAEAIGDGPTRTADHAAGRLLDRRRQAARAAIDLAAQRVPARRRRGGPRVALCVSGQLRGYEAALSTWRRTLLRSAECDVFIHTWARVGRSSAEAFRATLPFSGKAFTERYRAVALAIGYDEITNTYPTLFAELERSATVTAAELRERYDTPHVEVEDDTGPQYDGWSNQDKMHAKIQAAHQLMARTGDEYDLVVRLRPDKSIRFTAFSWNDLRRACQGRPRVLADHRASVHYAHLVMGDQFAIGGRDAMEIYSTTWSRYPALAAAGLFDCPESFAGHSSLAQVCWVHGINVEKAPIGFGPLQEAASLDPTTVLRCLEQDTAGRASHHDTQLLEAARSDVRGS